MGFLLSVQANYLKHGDSSKTNALSIEDQGDLWEGIRGSACYSAIAILTRVQISLRCIPA